VAFHDARSYGYNGRTNYVPPAPPVMFTVDRDVFYPFHISAALPQGRPAAVTALLSAVVAVWLVLAGDCGSRRS
jgi:hypothetical protein